MIVIENKKGNNNYNNYNIQNKINNHFPNIKSNRMVQLLLIKSN